MRSSVLSLAALRGLGVGLVAQGLAFGAMVLPIVLGRGDVLVFVVLVGAVTTVLLPAATLCAGVRLPVARDRTQAVRGTAGALCVLAGLSVVLCASGAALALAGPRGAFAVGVVFVATAVFLFGQGLSVIALALMTRVGALQRIYRFRLIYAAGAFVLTLGACLTGSSGAELIMLNTVAYLVAVADWMRGVQVSVRWAAVRAAVLAVLPELATECRRAAPLVLSLTMGTVGGQIAALSAGLVGGLQQAWAGAVRVTGGFQTVGTQLLAPRFDIMTGRAARTHDADLARTALRRSAGAGAGLGAVGGLVAAGAVWWIGRDTAAGRGELILVTGAAAIFCLAAAVSAVDGRFLAMLGPASWRLAWDAVRAVSAAVILLALEGAVLAGALAGWSAVAAVSYLMISRAAVRRLAISTEER